MKQKLLELEVASIGINHRMLWIPAGHLLAGYYQTETEAAKAYDKACIVTKGKPKNLPESTYEVRRCKLTLA